jgi:hypothetical protein
MSADGDWKVTMNTPMGPQQVDLTIKTNGSTFSGTAKSGQFGELPIGGQVEGDTLKWEAKITTPMPMTLGFSATVDGDKLTGQVSLGAFGSAPLTGVRA